MKCIKCGTENLDGTKRCKECEYPLEKQLEFYDKTDKGRNITLIVLFNALFSFVLPILILLILSAPGSNEDVMLSSYIIVFTLMALSHFLSESLSFNIVKSIVKNTEYFKKATFYYDVFSLLCYFLIAVFMLKEVYWILIILSVTKVISFVLSDKFVLKEKIILNKKYIIGFLSYLLLLFLIPNLFIASNVNKALFKILGKSSFSSKNLQIELIEKWNDGEMGSHYFGEVTYFHKFTDSELKEITELSVSNSITNKDIKSLKYLEVLTIKNSKLNDIFSNNLGNITTLNIINSKLNGIDIGKGKLEKIYIENSDINKINVNESNNLELIDCTDSNIDDINISNNDNLEQIKFIKSKITNVLITNNTILKSTTLSKVDKLEITKQGILKDFLNNINGYEEYLIFRTLIFDDKKISFNNNEYIKFDGTLYVKENSLVKDLLLENLTAKVYDHYHEKIRCEDDSCYYSEETKIKEQGLENGLSDELKLYDKSDLILDCDILALHDYDLKR